MRGMRFDPAKAITFDLEKGLVHLEGAPARVLVPAGALGALCAAAGLDATAAFGRELGATMGRRVAGRLAVLAAPAEALVEHLGGELALAGLGTLGIERWGRALVIVLEACPLGPEADRLLEAVLEGALSAASGREARALRIDRDGARVRFLIASGAAVERVRAWLSGGASWGDALVKLHNPPRGEA